MPLSDASRKEMIRRFQMPGATPGTQAPGKLAVDDFTYAASPVTISASGTSGSIIKILPNENFVILSRGAVWFVNAADVQDFRNIPAVLVRLVDVASDRELCQWVPLGTFAGRGALPADLSQLKRLSANQCIRLEYKNAMSVPVTLQVFFIGKALF